MNPLVLFLYMLRAALLSSGGMGNVSGLHDDFVPRGWSSDTQFVQALTVGQISPGPNGLWAVSLGYLILGPLGSIVSLLAIVIPPCLVIGIDKLYTKVQHHPAVEGLVRGLMLAVVGTVATVLVKLLQGPSTDTVMLGLAVVAFGLGWIPRIPVIAIMTFCGFVGLLTHS